MREARTWRRRVLVALATTAFGVWSLIWALPSPAEECESLLESGAYPAAIEAGRRAVHANPRDPYGQSCLTLAYYRLERAKGSQATAPTRIRNPAL